VEFTSGQTIIAALALTIAKAKLKSPDLSKENIIFIAGFIFV
jgi:hypothetical protein